MAKAVGQFTIIDLNDITISSTAPAVKIVDMIWLDTSVVPNQLKKWSGTAWINIGDRNADIEIGDRNLLLKSNILKKNTSYPIATYDLAEPIAQGEVVTLVIKGSLGGGKTYFRPYNSGGSVSISTLTVYPTDFVNGIAVKTGTWVVGSSTNTKLYVYPMPSSTVVESTIEWIKLVRGDITSKDWTPAPEDTDQKFTAYYTKTETNTQINAAKDAINLSVDTKISTAATTINNRTDQVLEDYSTTTEMTAAINLKGAEIDASVSSKIIGTYYQESTPNNPKNKEIWYRTEHSNYIVNNMSMTVNSLTGVTVNELTPVNKLYRYNGTTWQLIEDSDIANVKADIAGINISVDGIVQKVEDSEGRIGLVELTSSQLSVDVANVKIKADTLEANINSLSLNIGTLTARIDTAQVDIGILNTNIGTLNASIDSIKLVTNSIEVAVNSAKLQFGSDGLTIKNGGFRIMDGNTTLLESTGGSLYLRGELRTGYVTVNHTGVVISPYEDYSGGHSGGELYFDRSNNRMILQALGWSVLIRTTNLEYGIGNTSHNFRGGDINIENGDLQIRGQRFVKKRLSDVQSYHYVLAYAQ